VNLLGLDALRQVVLAIESGVRIRLSDQQLAELLVMSLASPLPNASLDQIRPVHRRPIGGGGPTVP
jgi:hypothetical protein